jgi:recombination protein U
MLPQKTGQAFEDLIELTITLYTNNPDYHFWGKHNHVAGAFHRTGRPRPIFSPLPKPQQPVDYTCCENGTLIAFDAKTTINKTRWTLNTNFIHQYERLQSISRSNAIAFFMIEQRATSHLFLLRIVPSSPFPSISFSSDPRIFGPEPKILVIPQNTEGWYDWLPAILRKWRSS